MTVVFFNQAWRAKQLAVGHRGAVLRQARRVPGHPPDDQPGGRRAGASTEEPVAGRRRTLRIVPVYPASAKAGLTSWEVGEWVAEALRRVPATFADPLPEAWRRRLDLVGPDRGLRGHPPPRDDGRHGAGPPPAGLRRAVPPAAGPGAAPPGPRARRPGHPPRRLGPGRHRADRRGRPGDPRGGADGPDLVAGSSGPPLRADRGPAPGPGRDLRRDWPGRCPCTGSCRATSGRARRWWPWPPCWSRSKGATRARSWCRPRCWPSSTSWPSASSCRGSVVADPGRLGGRRPLSVALLTSRTTATERARAARGPGRRAGRPRGRHPRAADRRRALPLARAWWSSTSSTASGSSSAPPCGTRGASVRTAGGPDGAADPDLLVMTATPIPRTAAMVRLRRPRHDGARRAAPGPDARRPPSWAAERRRRRPGPGSGCATRWRPATGPTWSARWSRGPSASRRRSATEELERLAGRASSPGCRSACCTAR